MEKFYVNLIKMYEIINTGGSIEDSLDYVYKSFKEFIPYNRVGLAMLDMNDTVYSFAVKTDYKPKLDTGFSLEINKTSLNKIVDYNKPRIINDYVEYLEENPDSSTAKLLVSEGVRSSISYPLMANNIIIGIFFFSSKKPNSYTEDYLERVRLIANNISIAIEKFLIVDDLILSSITGFAKLVEAKDSDTGLHIERMQNYSRIIAKGLSNLEKYKDVISYKYVDDIYKFSPLHDIGKVGIADGILLKPGKLTHQEFEVMKTHTVIGGDVLKKAYSKSSKSDRHYFDMGIEIALGHHERYDGKGYPYGLSGDDIPLSARIVMAADVLDALTSKRAYKEAIDIETSINMMVDERGKMFDPDIISILLKYKRDILDIYYKFHEEIEWSR
ncbi:MAG: HD domain-containing phosphohydrolase [Clostridiaceae bacterium]